MLYTLRSDLYPLDWYIHGRLCWKHLVWVKWKKKGIYTIYDAIVPCRKRCLIKHMLTFDSKHSIESHPFKQTNSCWVNVHGAGMTCNTLYYVHVVHLLNQPWSRQQSVVNQAACYGALWIVPLSYSFFLWMKVF